MSNRPRTLEVKVYNEQSFYEKEMTFYYIYKMSNICSQWPQEVVQELVMTQKSLLEISICDSISQAPYVEGADRLVLWWVQSGHS